MKAHISLPQLHQGRLLKEICTFGIGGPAQFYMEIKTVEEMHSALMYCEEQALPFFILGKGSNCLFDDRGFAGVVIHNKIDFKEEISKGVFHVGAGYSFSLLGSQTARAGWSGLEFASGIPGSVGGAVFMNAGANGKETCETLISVDFMTPQRHVQVIGKEDLRFSYRTSSFQKIPGVILGATFALENSGQARQKQIEIITYRKNTQPYGDKSAGCIFRNPAGGYAGALIEKCGLKGVRMGGAQVSEMHANFIVNIDKAEAREVLELIRHIKHHVKNSTGVDLEAEVRYIPFETESL